MTDSPPHAGLAWLLPGERLVLLLREDREVRLLYEGAIAMIVVFALGLLSVLAEDEAAKPLSVVGILIAVFTGLGASVFRARALYAITDRRVIADPMGERPVALGLDDVVTVSRWCGNVRLKGRGGAKLQLTNLREAVSVAALIEDRVAP